MKQQYSSRWKSSTQPRKQIKYRANAPLHIQRTFMASLLDSPLRKKYGTRSIPIRKGDEVTIMRGAFKKKKGTVGVVDVASCRVQIEGVQREKRGGEKLETWFHPSTLRITSLYEDDSRRFKHFTKKKDESTTKKPTTEK